MASKNSRFSFAWLFPDVFWEWQICRQIKLLEYISKQLRFSLKVSSAKMKKATNRMNCEDKKDDVESPN